MIKPPECRLDRPLKREKEETRHAFGLFSKGVYSPGVKIHGWEDGVMSKPYDVDDSYKSGHYKSLGTEHIDYLTENKDKFVVPKRISDNYHHTKLVNFYSYNEDEPYNNLNEIDKVVISDYLTTMQSSYKPPHPYVMQRLSLPATPYFLNRKLKQDNTYSSFKFYDEEFAIHIKRLQSYKKERHVSFNPLMGKYTDGSL